MRRIILTCLVVCATMIGISTGTLSAAELNTGYLVINGRQVEPPYRIEIVESKVVANGIQIYPHIPTPAEIAEDAEKQEAKNLLQSLHEQFTSKQKVAGHDAMMKWLRAEIRKHPKYKNAIVRETKMGVEVNLKGITDLTELRDNIEYVRHMREDNAPGKQKQINAAQERLARRYEDLRARSGKESALLQFEKELKQEPLVGEYKIDREHESYWVRWKGRPYGGSVGLRARERGDRVSTKEGANQKALSYQLNEVVDPLRRNECVVVLAGGAYSSDHGRPACEEFLMVFRDHPGKEQAMIILSRHFSGRERYIWHRLSQLWK